MPNDTEWDILIAAVGDSSTAGTKLKAARGWNDYGIFEKESGNGTDTYSFSALPGGVGISDGGFNYIGKYGNWWSASEYAAYGAYSRYMSYNSENVGKYNFNKSYLRSVRCVQD